MLKLTYNFRNCKVASLDFINIVVVIITDKLYMYFVGLHNGHVIILNYYMLNTMFHLN